MGDPLDSDSGMPRRELDLRFRSIDQSFENVRQQRAEDAQQFNEKLDSLARSQEETLKLLRNGAQASLLTTFQLNGDASLGIKGFIPQIHEDIDKLRGQGDERDEKIAGITKKIDRILLVVEYIAKFFRWLYKLVDPKIWLLIVFTGLCYFFPDMRNSRFVHWLQYVYHLAMSHKKE